MNASRMRLPSAVDDAKTAIKSNRVDIDRYWTPLRQSGLGIQRQFYFGTGGNQYGFCVGSRRNDIATTSDVRSSSFIGNRR